ncbi:hypothetical protein HU200_037870 [Digitaria exilis]|uniref:Phytocyanin domain-containing protein n=1 Tax=Digitaria exilis TaxID=1010633 RepID=A0A835EKU7_9POAL|nr:hypothetical protein HU200_037870 [Digitaria exilis]CAB3453712.1 unnamed protein product [Digitaria exilis]
MAGFRSTVLFAASFAVLLHAASQSSSPSLAVYDVGDEMGWTVPPPGATDALNAWAARHRFVAGDSLCTYPPHLLDAEHHQLEVFLIPCLRVSDFNCGGSNDSVLLVSHGEYERCSASGPPSLLPGGSVIVVTLVRPGLFYFIGGEPARCEAGQRMAVRVDDHDARSPSLAGGAPAPAKQPFDDAPVTEHRGLSLAQKQFAAAAIGFGAGFALVFFVVWLCVCCGSLIN